MANSATLIVKILTDASGAASGIGEVDSKFSSFNSTMRSLVGPATAVLGAITAGAVKAVDSASNLQQAMGGVDAVFGDSAGQIREWSATAADSVGLAASDYGSFAATIGAQLKNLGVPMQDVATDTDSLIRLGADLAATYGGSTEQAVSALSSALRGEADPAEKYGLALNQTAVNAYLAEQGLTGLEGSALTAAKAQAVMALAAEQAGGAVGQFGRESDTLAGQQQRLNAKFEDAAAALGESLLPIITPVAAALGELAGFIQQNTDWIVPLIAAIAALAAGVIIYTAAQWALNAAMSANPIALIIIAIAALVAGFIVLWNTNEGFRNFFIGLWEGLAAFFTGIWNGLMVVVSAVVDFFVSAWNVAVALVSAYINIYVTIFTVAMNVIRAVVDFIVKFFVNAWNSAVQTVVNIVQFFGNIANSVLRGLAGPINFIVGLFNNIVGAIQNVINWLGRIKIPDVLGSIGGILGFSAQTNIAPLALSAGAATPGLYAASAAPAPVRAAPVSGGGTVLNIYGGLDSADTIARRVSQVLADRARRNGGVRLERWA